MTDDKPTLKLEVTHADVDNLLWALDRLRRTGIDEDSTPEIADLQRRLEALGDTFSHAEFAKRRRRYDTK